MKTVRMLITMSGPRHDGRMWPPAGESLDVPDWEAESLCDPANAWAELVKPPRPAKPAKAEAE